MGSTTGGEINEAEALAALKAAAAQTGQEPKKIEKAIRSGFTAGLKKPRSAPAKPRSAGKQSPNGRDFGGGGDAAEGTSPTSVPALAVEDEANPDSVRSSDKPAGRPEITANEDEHLVVDRCLQALSGDPDLYQMDDGFACVLPAAEAVGPKGLEGEYKPRIIPIGDDEVRRRLTKQAELWGWVKDKKGNERRERIHPPTWLPKQICAHTTKAPVRHLTRISPLPILLPDGSLWDTPGWHKDTGILYEPGSTPMPTIVPCRDRAAALAAAQKLLEPTVDFPFQSDADKSVWLSIVLTTVGRHLFQGPSPLHLVLGNKAGTGKGKLINIAGLMATGSFVGETAMSSDNGEIRKAITTLLMAHLPIVHLDNLPSGKEFGSSFLDQALTAHEWGDRQLSTNKVFRGAVRMTWCASGNNVRLKGDLGRRTLYVRLMTRLERPESRDDFRYPDVVAYVRAHWRQFAATALSLLAGYLRAGRPAQMLSSFGSYEGYSALVRSVIVWAGYPDPVCTMFDMRKETDTEALEREVLLRVWREVAGHDPLAAAGFVERLQVGRVQFREQIKDLMEIGLPDAATCKKHEMMDELPYLLRKHKNITCGEYRLNAKKDSHKKVQVWWVERDPSAADPATVTTNRLEEIIARQTAEQPTNTATQPVSDTSDEDGHYAVEELPEDAEMEEIVAQLFAIFQRPGKN